MFYLPPVTDEEAAELLDLQSCIDADNAIEASHIDFPCCYPDYDTFMRDCYDDESSLIDDCLN